MTTIPPPPTPPRHMESYGWERLRASILAVEKTSKRVQQRIRKDSFWQSVAEVGGLHYNFFSVGYLTRLGVSIVFFLMTGYLNSLSSAAAGYRTPNVRMVDLEGQVLNTTTLPDLGHDVVSYATRKILGADYVDYYELPDMFVSGFLPLTLIFVLLHPRRLMIFRRTFAIFGFLNLLRSFTVIVTSLPDASPTCMAQFENLDSTGLYKTKPLIPNAFYRAKVLMFEPGEHVTCGDMVFSGHSVFLLLCACIFHEYCRNDQCPLLPKMSIRLFRFAAWTACWTGLAAIIATKLHYTLDVSISVFLTISIWSTYHRRCHFVAVKSAYPALASAMHPHQNKWQNFATECFEWLEAEEVFRADRTAWIAFDTRLAEWRGALEEIRRGEDSEKDERDSSRRGGGTNGKSKAA